MRLSSDCVMISCRPQRSWSASPGRDLRPVRGIFRSQLRVLRRAVLEFSVALGYRVGATAVAEDAARLDGAIETEIHGLVSRGWSPAHGLGIVRQRSLEEIVIDAQNGAESIHSRADDPLDGVLVAEGFLAIGADSSLALVELSVLGEDLESRG